LDGAGPACPDDPAMTALSAFAAKTVDVLVVALIFTILT
jgi:hypothetical protein